MEIYIDILLLENFVINLFLIVVMVKLLKGKRRRRREIIAAVVGSFYTLVMVFPKLNFLAILPFKIIISIIMVHIALKCNNIKEIIKGTVLLILTSFLLSGICFWFSLYINGYDLRYGYTIDSYPIKYSVISVIIIFLLLERIVSTVKDRLFVENYTYNLTIKYKNQVIEAKGFLDTGNELREPITNLPVIVIEKNICTFLDFNEKEVIYINFKTVDGAEGKLRGFKIEEVVIENEKCRLIRDAIICITENILSGEGAYNALLSRGIV